MTPLQCLAFVRAVLSEVHGTKVDHDRMTEACNVIESSLIDLESRDVPPEPEPQVANGKKTEVAV
jgi:hypothetical protein